MVDSFALLYFHLLLLIVMREWPGGARETLVRARDPFHSTPLPSVAGLVSLSSPSRPQSTHLLELGQMSVSKLLVKRQEGVALRWAGGLRHNIC